MLALVVIPANTLFLDAYGAKWLPATYIAIAVFGTAASALIARAARRTTLVRVATASLSALAVLYAASWLILVAGGVWVSARAPGAVPDRAPDRVRFHRRTGGPAPGRAADEGAVSAGRGRILGRVPPRRPPRHPAPRAAGIDRAPAARRDGCRARVRRPPARDGAAVSGSPLGSGGDVARGARPSARTLFASGLVLLLLVYQVLSAMGSWLVDYLLFNRAHAHYSGDDLTRFLSWYTALLNLADILFLALLAGPLMRRFGLRLGLVLNPAVVAALLVVMAVVRRRAGRRASRALRARGRDPSPRHRPDRRHDPHVGQRLVPGGPDRDRLAVQAVVEGIGVPVAIGATGAVLLVMNLVGLGIGAVIVFGVVLSVIWTASGAAMYRSYTRALADEMRRRSLAAARTTSPRTTPHCRRCSGPTMRATCASASTCCPASRRRLPRSAPRGIASRGPGRACACARPARRRRRRPARPEAGALAADLAPSADPADRRAAAAALGSRDGVTAAGACSSRFSTTPIRRCAQRRSTP